VRQLKREIAAICRSVAKDVASDEAPEQTIVDEALVVEVRGPQKYFRDVAERTARSGVATGLAWTPVGGDILFIEATMMKGKGSMILTGQMGDVMKESATAAMSFVRSNAAKLGVDEDTFHTKDIHIHIPAGSIPKDGPSAGVTMITAITSLLTDRPVDHELSMTGEITLRGLVLPVGGIKEKVLAAARAGIKRVLLPTRNEKDLLEIGDEVELDVEFTTIATIEDALKLVLGDDILDGKAKGPYAPTKKTTTKKTTRKKSKAT
jgi:ATP-dependent Lon protease